MSWLTSIIGRLSALFRKGRLDADLDDELRFHLEMEEQENIRNGMSAEEARRQARLRLGGMEQVKEEYRDVRSLPFLESLSQDVRFALRSFAKGPGFTATVLATLALGTGVGTAVFSVVNAVLIHPLPYAKPDGLVMLWNVNEEEGWSLEAVRKAGISMSRAELADWHERSKMFAAIAGFMVQRSFVIERENPLRVTHLTTTPGFLSLLGVQPALGRGFLPEEEHGGGERVAILLHDFWKQAFGADPTIVGRSLNLEPYGQSRVVGVLPPGFRFYQRDIDMIVPDKNKTALSANRSTGVRSRKVIARLAEGVSLEQAQMGADVLSAHLEREHPSTNRGWQVHLVPVSEDAASEVQPAAGILCGVIVCVLLIMCANVASLLAVRSAARGREMAVRLALGAERGRLVRQLLTETLILAAAGGAMGLLLAHGAVALLRSALPDREIYGINIVQLDLIQVSSEVVLFASVVSLTAVLFGLAPAFRATRIELNAAFKEDGSGVLRGWRVRSLDGAFVAGQVALAVVLTVSAVLLLRTVATLYSQDVGFEPDGLLIISVAKPRWELNALRSQIAAKARQNKEGVPTSEDIEPVRRWHESFDKRLEEVLSAIPGVQSVATAQQTPIARATEMLNEVGCAEGASSSPKVVRGLMETVSPAYFRTMGIPLLSGRGFGPGDRAGTQRIALVNRTLARQCWPDGQAIGKTIKTPWDEPTVIGVVGDVRDLGADREPVPKLYWSRTQYRQQPAHTVMLRTERDAATILPEVRKAIREAHPETPTYHVRLGEDLVRDSNWKRRYLTILLGSLGSLALILASLGVYGLVGQAVRERTREIGLRMAVGAAPSEVLWMVLRKGFSIATIGIVVGSVAAMGLTRFLESLLYGVAPLDRLTFAFVAVVMMVAAFLASYLPARSATRVDPMAALRHE